MQSSHEAFVSEAPGCWDAPARLEGAGSAFTVDSGEGHAGRVGTSHFPLLQLLFFFSLCPCITVVRNTSVFDMDRSTK